MRKKVILVALIWIVLAAVVFVLYWKREVSPVKEIISWAISVWPLLAVLGTGAIALSVWIIKHDSDRAKKKEYKAEIGKEAVTKSENLTETLTAMHRRLEELQKEKAARTKIRLKQLEKVLPALADRMGTVKLEEWPDFEKKVKQRVKQATPKRNLKRPFSFIERAKWKESVHFAALSVASKLKDELFQAKKWTFKDGLKVSEWLDGYNWGVKELRDNDPQWKALSESISPYFKDNVLRKLIGKHIDFSYIHSNVSLIVRYSNRYPRNAFSLMLHETLVGSPISPVEAEMALAEILNKIEKRLAEIKDSTTGGSDLPT